MKALIDADTCGSVSTNDNCGDDAMGYYETFEYNGNRVIIVSGAPDHDAESELFIEGGRFNPNTRCKIISFIFLCSTKTKKIKIRSKSTNS